MPVEEIVGTDGFVEIVPVEEIVGTDAFVEIVPVLEIVPLMAVFPDDTVVEFALDAAPVLEIVPLIAVFVDDALVALAPLIDMLEEDVLMLVSIVADSNMPKMRQKQAWQW